MTYLSDEQSAHGGRPRELYAFEGTFLNYYFTSGPVPVVFDGNTYLSVPVQRSEVGAGSQDDDGLSIQIELPASLEMIQVYAFQIAPPALKLTIYRYHNIAEWVPYWQGLVGQVNVSKGVAVLRSPSILELVLTGSLPNAFYQTPCNHVLYDQLCTVDPTPWTQVGTVEVIAGRTLTLDTIGTLDGKLVGGEAVLGSGESRMIVSQAGDLITVNYPYSNVDVGDAITVRAGCNLSWTGDCITKFNNGPNFGGFAHIPPDNIFSTSVTPGKNVADVSCLASCTGDIINLDARANAATSPAGAAAVGILISGYDPSQTIQVTLPPGQLYTAYSVWGGPAHTGFHTGSGNRFNVIPDGDTGAMFAVGTNPPGADGTFGWDGYEAARAGFGVQTFTGASSYLLYLDDTPITDNSGGLSIHITVV
jgi:hypothetical protein